MSHRENQPLGPAGPRRSHWGGCVGYRPKPHEPSFHLPVFRFLAASTRLTRSAAEASSASQIRNSVSTVGDLRSRSSWLTEGRDRSARNESCSCVSPARSRSFRNSAPITGWKRSGPPTKRASQESQTPTLSSRSRWDIGGGSQSHVTCAPFASCECWSLFADDRALPRHGAIVRARVAPRRFASLGCREPPIGTATLRRLPAGKRDRARRPRVQSNCGSADTDGTRERMDDLYKRKLRGRLALKPALRTARCRAHERTRSTRRLLEHATEVTHRLQPIRSIHTRPVQNGGQFVGDCATLVVPQPSARPIEQHDVLWFTHDGITTDFHAEEPGEVA